LRTLVANWLAEALIVSWFSIPRFVTICKEQMFLVSLFSKYFWRN
jgi:hypothetical protein